MITKVNDKMVLYKARFLISIAIFSSLAFQWIEASSEVSSINQLKVGAIDSGQDVLHHKKKRQRLSRRRRKSKSELGSNDKNESSVDSIVDTSQPLLHPADATTPERKRRQKEVSRIHSIENSLNEDCVDVLIGIPDEQADYDTNIHSEISEVSTDDQGRFSSQTQPAPMLSETSNSLPSTHLQYDIEEGYISSTFRSDDFTQLTHTEVSEAEGPNSTVTMIQQSSLESEKTELAERCDGESMTFVQQRRQRTVKIITKSRLTESNDGISTTKTASNKRTKQPNTGKEGECLRRLKREWKDAVQMGIAYDWTNMKTIKRKECNSQNNYVRLGPFGKNLLRWHFSVMGPANSVYQNGIYHGRVLLPKDYPGSPPRVQVMTPSGRFVCGEDICLSASNYHPETWTPRWTVISLVDALRLHMLTTANEIGGLVTSDDKRRSYAESSRSWFLPGIADHRQMVTDGIFSLHEDDTDVLTVDDLAPLSKQSITRPASTEDVPIECEADEETSVVLNDHPKKTKSNKSHDITTKASKKSKHTEIGNASGTPNKHITKKSLTKRLVVEILKLPLRLFSILLMLLTMVESKLRNILDSL